MIRYKDKCVKVDWDKDFNKSINDNYKLMNSIIKDCVEKNTIEGLILSFGVADGEAYYQIIKVNKTTVNVELCENLGDDYRLATIGVKGTIKKQIALSQLEFKKYLINKGLLNL